MFSDTWMNGVTESAFLKPEYHFLPIVVPFQGPMQRDSSINFLSGKQVTIPAKMQKPSVGNPSLEHLSVKTELLRQTLSKNSPCFA